MLFQADSYVWTVRTVYSRESYRRILLKIQIIYVYVHISSVIWGDEFGCGENRESKTRLILDQLELQAQVELLHSKLSNQPFFGSTPTGHRAQKVCKLR